MADGVAIKVTGLPQFKERLRALGYDMERRVVRSGALAAGAVFRKSAAANAPTLKKPAKNRVVGALKKAVYAGRSRSKSARGLEVVRVGVRAGGKLAKSASDPFYWRWVEAGHLVRGPGQKIKGGRNRAALERSRLKASGAKFVPGFHFLRDSFRDNQSAAISAFNSRIEARIQKANRDLNTK
jgi:HK97 gp10 family phage protein